MGLPGSNGYFTSKASTPVKGESDSEPETGACGLVVDPQMVQCLIDYTKAETANLGRGSR